MIRTVYWHGGKESVAYALFVWGMVLIGTLILAAGFDQPLVLLVIAGCVAAFMMFIYSGLLIVLGRRLLPPAIRPTALRTAALAWAVVLFGLLSAVTIADQLRKFAS